MIDWEKHPDYYQLIHWWHWLTYGQNAAAVQAVCAIVATAAAIVAGLFAVRAYGATLGQLRIARGQWRLAHRQFIAERERLDEERHQAAQSALAIYQRTVSEE